MQGNARHLGPGSMLSIHHGRRNALHLAFERRLLSVSFAAVCNPTGSLQFDAGFFDMVEHCLDAFSVNHSVRSH